MRRDDASHGAQFINSLIHCITYDSVRTEELKVRSGISGMLDVVKLCLWIDRTRLGI